MKTRTILKTALVVALFGISSSSFAITVTNTFTGLVANSCTASVVSNGTLGLLGTKDLIGNNTVPGGAPGVFNLSCSGTATLNVAGGIQVTGAAGIAGQANNSCGIGASVYNATTNAKVADYYGGPSAPGNTSGDYNVVPNYGCPTALLPGDYAMSVTTTITPN